VSGRVRVVYPVVSERGYVLHPVVHGQVHVIDPFVSGRVHVLDPFVSGRVHVLDPAVCGRVHVCYCVDQSHLVRRQPQVSRQGPDQACFQVSKSRQPGNLKGALVAIIYQLAKGKGEGRGQI
jgi:hypothetical protein